MFLNEDLKYMVNIYLNHMRLKSADGVFMLGYVMRVAKASTNEEHLEYYLPKEIYEPLHLNFDATTSKFPTDVEREKFFNLFYFHKGLVNL